MSAEPVRVYLTLDVAGVRALAQGEPVGGVPAFAVTSAVREAFPGEDEEDLEYDALLVAAEGCPGRILVAAADLPPRQVQEAGPQQPWQVSAGEVTAGQIVSVHVGSSPDGGDEDDLSWYDATELPHLADEIG